MYHYAVHLTEAVEVGSIQTTVISLQGSQDVIGADACFLTSGSVNVQLVLREVRVEGCLGRVDFRACFQGCVIVVHYVEEVVQITTRLVLHVQLDVA